MSDAITIQREYYARTATGYDSLHVHDGHKGEHDLSLELMVMLMRFHECKSVLDLGSGTGRTIVRLKEAGRAGESSAWNQSGRCGSADTRRG